MRPRRLAALVAFVLAALPALAAPALAAPPAGADAARARHEAIIRYWTPERMRSAIPRDFVRDPQTGAFRPAAKPPGGPGGGGGGGGGGNVTGASWPNGKGSIYTTVGRVLFTMGGSDWICSGVAASDSRSGESVVLSAAHCAYDETANGASSGFATNWMFIPQFDTSPTYTCTQTTHGCWTASALVVHRGYATAGGFNTQATLHDWSFAILGTGGKNTTLVESLGSWPIAASTSYASNTRLSAFGYPAAGKYKGRDLTWCAGPIFFDPYNEGKTYGMTCDMTGGSSGGPWLFDLDEATGNAKATTRLASVNSYGYSGVKAMHGPKFDANTEATWNAANSSQTTGNTIVGP